jgi:hypothetical protein
MICGSCAANRSSNGSPAPTPHGRAIAVLFTKTYGHVLTPGLTDLSPALPSDIARRSPLATAWRQLDRALDQHITAGLAAA